MILLFEQSLHIFSEILEFLFENSESSDSAESEEEFNEEETIKYYFSCGYNYNEILNFLKVCMVKKYYI